MSILKEEYDEILDDLKGRFRNPLILSFLLVWCYKHWTLIYFLFTVPAKVPIFLKLEYIKHYIHTKGFCGMIVYPLLFAFFSLFVYYIIGIAAQVVKIIFAKRLRVVVVRRLDSGQFDTKEETDKLKREKAKLRAEAREYLLENEELRRQINDFDNGYEKEITELEGEIDTLQKDLEAEIGKVKELTPYKKQFDKEKSLYNGIERSFLKMLETMRSNTEIFKGVLQSSNQSLDPNEVLRGEWEIKLYGDYTKNSYSTMFLRFDDKNIYDKEEKVYAKIDEFLFERNSKLLYCKIVQDEKTTPLFLAKINQKQFIGFWNEKIVGFDRVNIYPKF